MTKRYTPGPPDDEKRRAIRRSEADLVSAWDNYGADAAGEPAARASAAGRC